MSEASGTTYQVHAGLPILLPAGRQAVDDLATALARSGADSGFAEAVRAIAAGEVPFLLTEPFGSVVSATDLREAAYRETDAYWETFSRNRLVQQQLTAIDTHWDALEEMWIRGGVNLAESILDVGTGWGGTFQRMLEHGPQDALIVGLDTAFLNLKIAEGRAVASDMRHASFVVGDISVPPLAPGMFDSVVSWFGIGFVPRYRECLAGVLKVLGPGQTFAAAWTPAVNDMEGLAAPDDLRAMATRLDLPVSPDAAVETARLVGFEDVEMTEVGPIYVLSGFAPAG